MNSQATPENDNVLINVEISALTEHSPIDTFICSGDPANDALQRFLYTSAVRAQTLHLAHTTIATLNNNVIGYITYGIDSLDIGADDAKAIGLQADDEVPVLQIFYLAIANGYRNRGIGSLLMDNVFEAVDYLQEKLACRLLVVTAYRAARSYYEKYRFKAASEATQYRTGARNSGIGATACTYMYLDLYDE